MKFRVVLKHGFMRKKQILTGVITRLFLCVIIGFVAQLCVTDVFAGSATVSEHYLGADVGFSHSTDASLSDGFYYGEACAFKYNIEATVYDSPAHAFASGAVSETGRCEFAIYLQTQSWGLRTVFETPTEDPTPDLTDPAIQAENYARHYKWFNERHGHAPACVAYQGGGAAPSTTGQLFHYMLAGRTSAMSAYNNDPAVWSDDMASGDTKYHKVSTRFGDDTGATPITDAINVFENAISAGGWFRDFCHWHTNPAQDPDATIYNFFKEARATIDSHTEKRIVPLGSGTHAQQAWYRSIATASLSDNGTSLELAVTYTVPSWMDQSWTFDGFTSKPTDCFVIPASITVDISGTSLSGSDLNASGAVSIRKIGTDLFVVEVPFNKVSETLTFTLTPTTTPVYANEALPEIVSIAKDSSSWTITTDQPTKLVLFTLPAGVALSDIEAKTSATQVYAPIRQNTLSSTHSIPLSSTSDSSLDYYVGVITSQKQSVLEELTEKGIVDPDMASNPQPSNGAVDVTIDPTLSWDNGASASAHDIYLGIDPAQVASADRNSPLYLGNVSISSPSEFSLSGLSYDTNYYWRVDAVNSSDVAQWKGSVWNFATESAPITHATNPSPANDSVTVSVDSVLGWQNGELATSHDIYFGTNQQQVATADRSSDCYMGNKLVSSPDSDSFDPDLGYGATYYWRVDAVNASDVAQWPGTVWQFTTFKAQQSLTGDFNGDHVVDLSDLELFAAQWLNGPGCPVPACADLDGVNGVDLDDLAIFSANWKAQESVNESITFLAHFNDTTSWDINENNGDYAAGSPVITVGGTPSWGTGFFATSTPSNSAFYSADSSQKLTIDNTDNIENASSTGGGITFGFWCKLDHNDVAAKPIIVHNSSWSSYWMLSFNSTQYNKWVATFQGSSRVDTAGSDATSYVTDWMYIAVAIDFDTNKLTLYQFDASGNPVAGSPCIQTVPADGWDVRDGVTQLNYNTGGIFIDEFSIDNVALDATEMQERVDAMVAGSEI